MQFFLHIGNYPEALARLEHCLRAHPRSALAQSLKGVELILSGKVEQGHRLLEEHYRRLRPSSRAALRRNLLKLLEPIDPGAASGESAGSASAGLREASNDNRGYLRHLLRHPARLLSSPRPLPRQAELQPVSKRKWYLAVESWPAKNATAAG